MSPVFGRSSKQPKKGARPAAGARHGGPSQGAASPPFDVTQGQAARPATPEQPAPPPQQPPASRRAQSRPGRPPLLDVQRPASRATPAEPSRPDLMAVRFAGTAAALAFLGAVHVPGVRQEPACFRSPDDGSLWITVPGGDPADAEIAESVGGLVYAADGRRPGRAARPAPADLAGWPAVNWILLAGQAAGGPYAGELTEAVVFLRGSMARAMIGRCREHSAGVLAAPVRLTPVRYPSAHPGNGADVRAERQLIRLRISAARGGLPEALLDGFLALPDTEVCRTADTLLLPHRTALPLADADLAAHVPHGETWLIGADQGGVWSVHERAGAREFEPALRVAVPPPRLAEQPVADWDADLSTQVRVVPSAADDRLPDAVLVTEEELPAVRTFLAARWDDDALQLVPGNGVYLFTEPGGLTGLIPFGTALRRLGPGALYLEHGFRLSPALPPGARARLYRLDGESIVVVCEDGAHRFALGNLLPAWSVWLGPRPQVADGLSEAAAARLRAFDEIRDPAEQAERAEHRAGAEAADGGAAAAREEQACADPARLYGEVQRDQEAGRVAEAARKLEQAGDFLRAARLYEQAAREAAESDARPGTPGRR